MYIVRNEHQVLDHESWKKAFDSDPGGREKSGVRGYRIFRSVDDALYVMVDLEFDTLGQAEAFLAALRLVLDRVEDMNIVNPQARIVETLETKAY